MRWLISTVVGDICGGLCEVTFSEALRGGSGSQMVFAAVFNAYRRRISGGSADLSFLRQSMGFPRLMSTFACPGFHVRDKTWPELVCR